MDPLFGDAQLLPVALSIPMLENILIQEYRLQHTSIVDNRT